MPALGKRRWGSEVELENLKNTQKEGTELRPYTANRRAPFTDQIRACLFRAPYMGHEARIWIGPYLEARIWAPDTGSRYRVKKELDVW